MLKYLILLILLIVTYFYKTKKSLHMIQQNLYNENNRYLKWIFNNYQQFFSIEILVIFLGSFLYFVAFDLEKIVTIVIITMMFIYIGKIYLLRKKDKNSQEKKPLVVTKRVTRLIWTTSILYIIPLVFGFIYRNDTRTLLLFVLILTILVYLNTLMVYLANIINKPIEKCFYLHWKHNAQNKLKSMSNLKIVGITGSYGKTSSKNILCDILNIKYNAFASPKNLNTFLGLMTSINNYMDKFTDIFIAEMGAYVKGEINGLCKLVNPKYGILTSIGTAHLETFGSEENIIEGKFELIEYLPSDGIGVLNKDDLKQVNYKLKNDCKIVWIGIDNEDVDVRALNISCSMDGTSFDVVFKNDKNKYHFQTKLLGKHNVYNILAAIALGREFAIDIPDLIQAVKGCKPVEHRLELKKLGNFYQIDDAYNSNPVGAKSALDVLSMMPGTKVVVTPGMIELGDKEYDYNKEFGSQIADVADYVVLIGEKRSKPMLDGLKMKKYDNDKIIVYNDVRDAYKFISGLKDKNGVYALFENDLPDTYNE